MTPSRTLILAGCLLAAAQWMMAQPATAPPAPPAAPAPAATPVPPAPRAPVAKPSPAAIPAPAPFPDIDLDAIMDNVNRSLYQVDLDAMAEQAAAARQQGEKMREMAEQMRANAADMKEWTIFDQDEQIEKLKDLAAKQQEKALEMQQKAMEKGMMFAQNVPTMPTPAVPPKGMIQAGRGVGGGIGYGTPVRLNGRNTSDNSLYERGKSALDAHRFDDALAAFTEIVSRGNDKVEGALYYKAYTLNKMGRRDEALATIAELRKTYPKSRWLDDAAALEVEVKQAAGKPVSPDEVSSDDIKILALNGLMQTDPDRAFPILEGLLKGAHSPALKRQAVYVLAQNQSPKAQALLEQIARGSTGNPDLQVKAISYFVDTRNKPDRAKLLADVYAGSSDYALKSTIIEAFRRSNDLEHLMQIARTEKNPDLRDAAINRLGDVDGQPELWQLYGAETTPEGKKNLLRYMHNNGNTEKLAEVARTDKDAGVRAAAILALDSHKGTNITATLVTMYGSEQDPTVKKTIIRELSRQRDAKSLMSVGRQEKDVELQKMIVQDLVSMKTPEANEYLLEIFKK